MNTSDIDFIDKYTGNTKFLRLQYIVLKAPIELKAAALDRLEKEGVPGGGSSNASTASGSSPVKQLGPERFANFVPSGRVGSDSVDRRGGQPTTENWLLNREAVIPSVVESTQSTPII